MRLVKRFGHRDGRAILAYDTERDGWIVEARLADPALSRRRWYPATEDEAAAIVHAVMGDGDGW